MNPLLITGTCIVFLALASYSLGLHYERKTRTVTDRVRNLLFLGLASDVTATCFMIAGSHNSPFTPHGFIGYAALGLMAAGVFLLARWRMGRGPKAKISRPLHLYIHAAYIVWVLAFVAGAVMGARMSHSA